MLKISKKKYMSTLLQHLESRFPDVKIIEAFSIFDVKSLPDDPVQRQSAGTPYLDTLCTHYGPHGVIAADSLKPEYPLFVNSLTLYILLHYIAQYVRYGNAHAFPYVACNVATTRRLE